jgi:hypothetical protein
MRSYILNLALCTAMLHTQLASAAISNQSEVDQECQTRLDQAEENYYNGDLTQAILLIRQCLGDKTLQKETLTRAYQILARCHLAAQEPDSAKKAIIAVLQIDPAYQPTIEQESPSYVKLVLETKKEQATRAAKQETTGINPWIWIGAGSAAAVAVIVLVAGGSGDDQSNNNSQALPSPPMLP